MIQNHEFNTRWWGSPVGVVSNPGFFSLDIEQQQKLLEPYAWAEFHSSLGECPPLKELADSGFFQIDTQIRFMLNLRKIEPTASTEQLSCVFADEKDFNIEAEQLAMFTHERFRHVPGCTETLTNERYALWANDLVREHPENCMQLFLKDRLQGWFLSRPGEAHRLNLALAMLTNTSEISGMLLYHQACVAYAKRGHRLGSASFSVSNTPVHNIYAKLGARFMPPGGNWLWLAN